MSIAHKYPARTKWRCDVCGKEEFWNDRWWSLGSIAMDEACPEDVPTVCSDECKRSFERKVARGEIVFPKIKSTPGGFEKISEREGY
jgi:hypothetical protein